MLCKREIPLGLARGSSAGGRAQHPLDSHRLCPAAMKTPSQCLSVRMRIGSSVPTLERAMRGWKGTGVNWKGDLSGRLLVPPPDPFTGWSPPPPLPAAAVLGACCWVTAAFFPRELAQTELSAWQAMCPHPQQPAANG